MRLEYSHLFKSPRQAVWETLLDPQVLSRVLPGVEKFETVGDEKYDVVVKLGVPAVKGTYSGTIEIADKQFPSQYRLRGQGKGAQGWVRGNASIELVEESEGTRVMTQADAQIGGRIAGVGQRMMEGVAKAMARELFESVDRELAGRAQKVSPFVFVVRVIVGWLRSLFGRRQTANPESRV